MTTMFLCTSISTRSVLLSPDLRLADHFGGKVHMGRQKIRQACDEWRQSLNQRCVVDREMLTCRGGGGSGRGV